MSGYPIAIALESDLDSRAGNAQVVGWQVRSCSSADGFVARPAKAKAHTGGSAGHRPRRRTRRQTHCLSPKAAIEVIAGVHEAIAIGLAPNTFITVDLELGKAADCNRVITRYFHRARAWLRRRGATTAFVWVQESDRTIGQHAHILIHIPAALRKQYLKRHRVWFDLELAKGVLKTEFVRPGIDAASGDTATRAAYLRNLVTIVTYMLKAVPAEARELALHRPGAPSIVLGKRSGTSQNVGRAARAKRGRHSMPQTPADIGLGVLGDAASVREAD